MLVFLTFLLFCAVTDVKTMECLMLCYSYFINPEELLYLFMLRYKMNFTVDHKAKKEQKRVEEIVRSRCVYILWIYLQVLTLTNII